VVPVARASLLTAQRDPGGKHEWRAATERGSIVLRPFLDISGESYSAYQDVVA
jgi:hypothetical protein